MGKKKTALMVLGGTAVFIVLFRALRNRRTNDTGGAHRPVNHEDPETATEHVNAAAEHTREAAGSVKES